MQDGVEDGVRSVEEKSSDQASKKAAGVDNAATAPAQSVYLETAMSDPAGYMLGMV